MTQQEALVILDNLLYCAQKLKSNLTESLCGDREPTGIELGILAEMHPGLFPGKKAKFDLINILYHYSEIATREGRIAPSALMNALYLCHQQEGFDIVYTIYGPASPHGASILPDPREAFLALQATDKE